MNTLLLLSFFFISFSSWAQTDTLSDTDIQGLMKELQKVMKTNFVPDVADDACKCIDSIRITNKSKEEVSKEIGACIEPRISGLLITEAMGKAMFDTSKRIINVAVADDPEARKYAYYRIERYLMDSCQSLIDIANSNEKESLNSVSDNPEALEYYSKGQDAFKEKNLKKAAYFYKKAVDTDENFAFAWDNLGLTYRYMKKYDKALAAYKKSLEISPNGPLPLQNIPVVYEHMKKPKLALEAYNKLTKSQPDNPEGYFGKGRILVTHMNRPVPALHSMCQAFMIYKRTNNPYRTDAEKVMGYIHHVMKEDKKEKQFYNILKQYKIDIRFSE